MTRAAILASLTWHYALHYAALGIEYPALLVLGLVAAWVLLLALRSAALWVCRRPWVRLSAVERDFRRTLGMPMGHPEKVATREHLGFLEWRGRQPDLWPANEYVEVIEAVRHEEGDTQ